VKCTRAVLHDVKRRESKIVLFYAPRMVDVMRQHISRHLHKIGIFLTLRCTKLFRVAKTESRRRWPQVEKNSGKHRLGMQYGIKWRQRGLVS